MKLFLFLFLFFININLNADERQYNKIEQDLIQKINNAKKNLPSCNGWLYIAPKLNQWIGNNLWWNRGTEEDLRIGSTAKKIHADIKHLLSKNPERYYLELSAKLKEKHPNFFANYDNEKEKIRQKIYKECYGIFYTNKTLGLNDVYEFSNNNIDSKDTKIEGLFVDNILIIGRKEVNGKPDYTGEFKSYVAHGLGIVHSPETKIKTVGKWENNLPIGKHASIDTRKKIIEYPSERELIKKLMSNNVLNNYSTVSSELNKKWSKKLFKAIHKSDQSFYEQKGYQIDLEKFYTARQAYISFLEKQKNNNIIENKIIDNQILLSSSIYEKFTKESIVQSKTYKDGIIFLRHLIASYPENHPYHLIALWNSSYVNSNYLNDILFFNEKRLKNIDQLSLLSGESYCEMKHNTALSYFILLQIVSPAYNIDDKYKKIKTSLIYDDIYPTMQCADDPIYALTNTAHYFSQLKDYQLAVNNFSAAKKYGVLKIGDIETYAISLSRLGRKDDAKNLFEQAISDGLFVKIPSWFK